MKPKSPLSKAKCGQLVHFTQSGYDHCNCGLMCRSKFPEMTGCNDEACMKAHREQWLKNSAEQDAAFPGQIK